MRRTSGLILLMILILQPVCRSAEGDWGYAHNMYIIKSLSPKWALLHRSQFTLRDDMSDLFFGFADIGIGYKFMPGWRVDGVYRRAWIQPGEKWLIEDRPLINLTWFGSWKEIRMSNRSRLEFREYRWDRKDDIRYRNETRIDLPWKILPGGIKPYLEEEFFWGRNSEEFEMNWLTGGIYCKPNPHTKLKLGYRWVYVRTGDGWENRNQLVTGLNFYF